MSKKRADKDKLNFKDVFKIGDVLIVVAIIVLVALTIAFSLKQGFIKFTNFSFLSIYGECILDKSIPSSSSTFILDFKSFIF